MVEALKGTEKVEKTTLPLTGFNPDLVSTLMPGWEEGEMRGIFGVDPDK